MNRHRTAPQSFFATMVLYAERAAILAANVFIIFFIYKVLSWRFSGDRNIYISIALSWALIAYMVLPRLHRFLTKFYVPNYFIGRTRTGDGLLGDPVNIAFNGSAKSLHRAMQNAGWTKADELSTKSTIKMIKSSMLKKSYKHAPVSSLYLFSRKQDFAYQQEIDGNPHKRHHVRFWKVPDGWILPGGYKVDWLAAGTYDRSVGFSSLTFQITHKIGENIDEERDYILSSLQNRHKKISVKIIKNYSTGFRDRNGGGDNIKTDGNLPVVTL